MRAALAPSGWLIPLSAGLVILLLGPQPGDSQVPLRLREAQSAVYRNAAADALSDLEVVLAREPALGSLHPAAAALALRAGDADKAWAHLDAADATLPADPSRSCLRIETRLEQGDLASAADAWRSSGTTCDDRLAMMQALGDRLWESGDFSAAVELLDRIDSLGAASVEDLRRIAIADSISDPASAASALRRALAANPRTDSLLVALAEVPSPLPSESKANYFATIGGLLARYDEWGLARNALDSALWEDPDLPIARAYLGISLERTGEEGWPDIWGAILSDPTSSPTWTVLGTYWLDKGDAARSLRAYQQAERLDPSNAAAVAGQGAALAATGRVSEAIDAYLHATRLDPSSLDLWRLLAQSSLRQSYQPRAIGLPAARNAADSSSDPRALSLLGYAHVVAGDPLLGRRLLLESIALSQFEPEPYYQLGLAYLALDDAQGAKPALQQAVNLDPGGTVGLLAQRTLESLSP